MLSGYGLEITLALLSKHVHSSASLAVLQHLKVLSHPTTRTSVQALIMFSTNKTHMNHHTVVFRDGDSSSSSHMCAEPDGCILTCTVTPQGCLKKCQLHKTTSTHTHAEPNSQTEIIHHTHKCTLVHFRSTCSLTPPIWCRLLSLKLNAGFP